MNFKFKPWAFLVGLLISLSLGFVLYQDTCPNETLEERLIRKHSNK